MTAGTTAAGTLSPAVLAAGLGLPPPTPEQAAVIAAPGRPALVVAGAGAGKTETMAARVVWLVATGRVAPDQVLGLTFTRKAAQQLGARVRARLRRLAGSRLLDDIDTDGRLRAALATGEPTVSTYHAYAGRLVAGHALRLPAEPGARLLGPTGAWQLAHRVVSTWAADLDVDRQPATVTALLLALSGELAEHLADPADVAARAAELARRLVEAPPAPRQKPQLSATDQRYVDGQRMRAALLPLVEAFAARKQAERAMDFADQMSIAARVAAAHPEVGVAERAGFRAVLLDEYQDTGHAQRVLLRALFGGGAGVAVTAVGDPLQSIYGWRGASAGNLPRFRTDFPLADGAPADEYGLLTSFRNPPEVLATANAVAAPLRATGTGAAARPLRPRADAEPGEVRVALLPDVDAEVRWVAEAVAAHWRVAAVQDRPPPTSAVLVRRRADMDPLAEALRAAGLPVEGVGHGGLLDTPEVRDLVSALRLVSDPLAGSAAVRLLTGARWRLGVADLAGLWARARALAPPGAHPDPGSGLVDVVALASGALPAEHADLGSGLVDVVALASGALPAEHADLGSGLVDVVALASGALPAEHAEQAGLVDALEDPGPPQAYSAAGYARIRRLARELTWLRSRLTAPLSDLVADAERVLLLDVETAARPGAVGRAHLDAFADVVADFSAGADVASLPALLDYLATAEQAEDGLTPGEVDVAADRVQVLTVHAAKGLEWEVVAAPHLVEQVFPARKLAGSWLTNAAELPVELRGDAADLPALALPADGVDRKALTTALAAHDDALDDRRRTEERRLCYVALTRAERVLLCSGHRWPAVGSSPRAPSPFLEEIAAAVPGSVEEWAPEPEAGEPNPATAREVLGRWPADPLGERSPAVHAGAELVRDAIARADQLALPLAAPDGDPEGWAADVEVLIAERAARLTRPTVRLPGQLTVSQLVELATDRGGLATRLRRPMPLPPNPFARRGTAFHAWLETLFGTDRLLDLDELPGAADDGAPDPAGEGELEELQTAFLGSEWARRRPVEVEVAFETVVAGVAVRGRMDAVFVDPDGGYTVVDWKTGDPPAPDAAAGPTVQLAAYRLAWAELAGCPPERVRAALHYVRANLTVAPADLLDAAGLAALVAAVPAG